MKKLVNVKFEWNDSFTTPQGPSYILTTKVGELPLQKEIHLFSDDRGFYDGNEQPMVFTQGLDAAKARIEKLVLTQLKK